MKDPKNDALDSVYSTSDLAQSMPKDKMPEGEHHPLGAGAPDPHEEPARDPPA